MTSYCNSSRFIGSHAFASLPVLLILGLCFSVRPANAQTETRPNDVTPEKSAAQISERRDPTDPQGELRRLLNQKEVVGGVAPSAPVPPALELKARVIGGTRKPTVLLSLNEKKLLYLQVGDLVALPERIDQSLRLVEVTAQRVVVEWQVDTSERKQLLLP